MQQVSRMTHMEVRLISKPRLSDLSVTVFHFTVFLLLLTNSPKGQSQMITPSQPIVAMVDNDIILPCHLEPAVDASDLTVEWARPDLDPKFVHLMRDGVELLLDKHPAYTERTSLSIDKLKRGDVSLELSKVKLSDAGTYRCLIPTSGKECVVELAVGSVSSPELMISKDSIGVLLQCESKGWYPKPEVLWLDGEGNLLSAGPAETVRGSDGLYTVSSKVTVEKKHSKSFTCRVQQKNISQTRETHVNVADELFMVQSSSAIRISISLAVCFLSIVVILFVVWRGRRNKTNNSFELQLLMGEEKVRLLQMSDTEKVKYFGKTEAKLDEELQKNEEEVEQVQQLITTLTNQKEDLKEQRDKLIPLPKEDMIQVENIKKVGDNLGYFAAKITVNQLQMIQHHLQTRMKKHEELIKSTDKLLEKTEGLIIKMTERKAKLERDKEEIYKQLKETQRQREELQKKLESEQQEREEERKDPSTNDPA